MTESKVFRLPEGIDASSVGKEVENFLRSNKNLTTEGTKTPDGYFVQAKEPEGSGWKQLAGMTMATQVQVVEISDTITVNVGNGKWSDKLVQVLLVWFYLLRLQLLLQWVPIIKRNCLRKYFSMLKSSF